MKPTLLLCLSLAACSLAEEPRIQPATEDSSVPASLDEVHSAYLSEDYSQLSQALQRLLSDASADPDAIDNALEVLEAAYADTSGRLDIGTRLPEGVDRLGFSLVRKQEPDTLRFRAVLQGHASAENAIERIQLVRLPDTVVLDSARDAEQASVFATRPSEDEPGIEFELEGAELDQPLASGAYEVRLHVDGDEWRQWFPLAHMVSSDVPEVVRPAIDALVDIGDPVLEVSDFRSPEYQEFERRSLGLYLVTRDGEGRWHSPWSTWIPRNTPALENTFRIGGTSALVQGSYWIAVTCGEHRRFGSLDLDRASRTLRPFYAR